MVVVFFFFLINQSSDGLVVVMAVGGCGWVGGCDVGVVGLWFGIGRRFQFVEVMGGNGGYRLGGGWWWLLVCRVCGFVHGCSSFKERERDRERERWKKRERIKKITEK